MRLTFKEYCEQVQRELENRSRIPRELLFEAKVYNRIPGTNSSYREDPQNTHKRVFKHAHVYAKQEGKGTELYSVDVKGKGHDGYRGTAMPKSHADYFRSIGYDIPKSNILEWVSVDDLSRLNVQLIIMEVCENDLLLG